MEGFNFWHFVWYVIKVCSIFQNKGKFGSQIKKVVLVNSYLEMSSQMKEMTEQSIEVLKNCPEDNLQLPYNFNNIMLNQKELPQFRLQLKMDYNPITLEGRLAILRGTLNLQKVFWVPIAWKILLGIWISPSMFIIRKIAKLPIMLFRRNFKKIKGIKEKVTFLISVNSNKPLKIYYLQDDWKELDLNLG